MRDLDTALDVGDELTWPPFWLDGPDERVGHLPFAFWLVKALRPELSVATGVVRANAYFAVCQALAAIHDGGRSHALGEWQGEPGGVATLSAVRKHNASHYAAFSTIWQTGWEAAQAGFADGSIDLLHIGRPSSGDAARRQLDGWRPRLSPRAIVLVDDIALREDGHDVWQFWEQAGAAFPSFSFTHANGLGVLGVGPAQAPRLAALFGLSHDPAGAARLRRLFASRGETFGQQLEITRLEAELAGRHPGRAMPRETPQAPAIAAVRTDAAELAARTADAETLRARLRDVTAAAEIRMGRLAVQHEAERMLAAEALRQAQFALQGALDHQQHLVQSYVGSTSWRLTRPLRVAIRLVRGGPAALARPAAALPPPPEPVVAIPHEVATPTPLKTATRELSRLRLDAFLASGTTLALPRAEQPEVSILLVLFNQAELTHACLASIVETLAVGGPAVEVVIVDNASTDRTAALLDRVSGATVLRNPANLHFLRAANLAAGAARGDALLLLNNDAQLLPGALASALRTLRSADDVGAVGGRIILPDGTLQEAGSIIWQSGACLGHGRGEPPDAPGFLFQRDVDYCSGAFLLTWAAVWHALGGFDERFAPAYYEETDYCVRLWEAGLRVVFDPMATILHFEFGSSVLSGDALALQARNHTVFQDRHAGWLAGQLPDSAANRVVARIARATRGRRILVVSATMPASLDAVSTEGGLLTLLVLSPGAATRPASLDPRVEFVPAQDEADAMAFLAGRPGYYDAIVLDPAAELARLRAELMAWPEGLGAATVMDLAPGIERRLRALPAAAPEPRAPAAELPVSRPATADVAMALPFAFPPLGGPAPTVAVLCHIYYPDMADEVLHYLRNLPVDADLYVSTDTDAKRDQLRATFRTWRRGTVDHRVVPNRGRDIAPKLVGFADVHAGYDLVLHLHAKRSDHSAFLAPWRSFLFETLLGSPAAVTSILDSFARLPRLGMVAPLHYEAVRRWIGWNGNLDAARALARRMGVALPAGRAIDFPSGSMFWARPAALRPLLDLGLSFDDFPVERDQQDHTPAHAIERLFFYSCEQSGHDWLKVADPAFYADPSAILPIADPAALAAFARDHVVRLTGPDRLATRPEPAPMMTEIPAGLAARLAARTVEATASGLAPV